MPRPATAQKIKLINDQRWRIILALRLAVKSAPLKPMVRAMEPNDKIRNMLSMKLTTMNLSDVWKSMLPTAIVMTRIMREKKIWKKNLLLTRFFAEIGEA